MLTILPPTFAHPGKILARLFNPCQLFPISMQLETVTAKDVNRQDAKSAKKPPRMLRRMYLHVTIYRYAALLSNAS